MKKQKYTNVNTLRKSRMGTTNDIKYAKKWYPKGTTPEDSDIHEFLPYNTPSGDLRIADRYGESEREDNERINANDPLKKFKNKQTYVEEYWGKLYCNLRTGKKTKGKKAVTAEKIKQVIETPTKPTNWLEYPCKVVKIDDFGNAMITLENGKIQGMIYNARKLWLTVWMEREVLFRRKNKTGKFIFEFPKSSQKLLLDYFDAYAKGMSEKEAVKKLFPLYGLKKVKEVLKSELNEKVLESIREEYRNAA